MIVLQIEHRVPHFDGWKKAFESDPINRKKSGVIQYSIFRLLNDPNYIVLDLQFETLQQAEDALTALRALWGKVEGQIMMNPQTRLLNLVETKQV
jgi:hypothetical protein